MGHYIRNLTDGVKKVFSSAESFVLQLQKAFVAVRDVLTFRQSESLNNGTEQSSGTDARSDSTQNDAGRSRSGILKYLYFPCLSPCMVRSSAENVSGGVYAKHCVLCASIKSGCSAPGACPKYCAQTFILISGIFLFYLYFVYNNDYVSRILAVLEDLDVEVAIAIFMFLFIIACLPLVWGYVVLNMAAGYRFGVFYGVFIVMVSVTIGLSLTHRFSQKFCNSCVTRALKCYDKPEYISGILKVLDGPTGLKVVALARLTPIPFGLQNGIFSMANLRTRYYVAASNIGLLPTQIINCYMGSTFKSGQDIIDQGGSVSGYFIFIVQILIGILLMSYVVRRARRELANVLVSSNASSVDSASSSEEHELIDVRISQPTSGTVV